MILMRDSKVMRVIIEYEDGSKNQWSHYDATKIEMALRRDFKQPMTYNMTPQEKEASKLVGTVCYTECIKPLPVPNYVSMNTILKIKDDINKVPIMSMEDTQDDFDAVFGTQINKNYDAEIKTFMTSTIGSFVIEGEHTDIALKKLEEFGFKKRSSAYGTTYYEGDSDKLPVLKIHGIYLKEYVPTP